MSTISFDRVVNVTVNINDRFPAVANFSIPLILTSEEGTSSISVDTVRSFSSLEEVEAYGYDDTTEVHAIVSALIGTRFRPNTFKIGYSATADAAGLTAINQVDPLFYAVILPGIQTVANLADLTSLNSAATMLRKLIFIQGQDDALRDDATATPADSLGAALRGISPLRIVGFHDNQVLAGNQHYHVRAAARISNVNYNLPNSHYTLKFKELEGAAHSELTDLQAQNLTGFIPGTGQDPNAGGFWNVYICTAGVNMVVEGTFMDGSFVDTTTFADWLEVTMQSNVLQVFTNNEVVPYDATGISMLLQAITQTLTQGLITGALTEARPSPDGMLLPAFEVSVQDITQVQSALQANRIAPSFRYCAQYAGATHFATIEGELKIATPSAATVETPEPNAGGLLN